MNFFNDIGNGLAAYPKAIGLIFSNGLWWYFLFPILLNILFFVGGFMELVFYQKPFKTG